MEKITKKREVIKTKYLRKNEKGSNSYLLGVS